jgi:hypothetical protein
VLARAREAKTPEAYDLAASLFPDTSEAEEARAAASRLREKIVLDGAGPTYQGRELVRHIQEQLIRLDCMSGEGSGAFDAVTIEGLRRPSNSKSTASQIFSLRSAFRFRGVVWSLSELS